MQKASWKREPGSAHASGKTEGVSQALPQPRTLVGDFRAHCHRSSLFPPPPAIRPFSLGSFQPLPLFSWVEETSKPQPPLPLWLSSICLGPCAPSPSWSSCLPSQLTRCFRLPLSSASPSSRSVCPVLHFHQRFYSHWHKLFFTFPLAK